MLIHLYHMAIPEIVAQTFARNALFALKQQHERSSLTFCVNYTRFIKVQSLINTMTFKRQKGINSLSEI